MILHPGILALSLGSLLTLLLTLIACRLALRMLFYWDPSSSSEEQLQLERQGELFSVLIRCALAFETVALILFLFTVDDLHPLFTGAMCATGVLNLDPAGWWTLAGRMVVCFGASFWLVLDGLDRRSEDAPLTRAKAILLLLLTPVLVATFVLQSRFFLGLQPEVITSCCGALFDRGTGLAAELAALPVRPAMLAFYGIISLYAVTAAACLRWPGRGLRVGLALLAMLLLPVGLAGIIAFVSLYIYQLPTHHCPFDLLQGHYGFVGYPLYAGLFMAVLFGVLPGAGRLLRKGSRSEAMVERVEKRWLWLALGGLLLFVVLASWPVVFGPFVLLGYS